MEDPRRIEVDFGSKIVKYRTDVNYASSSYFLLSYHYCSFTLTLEALLHFFPASFLTMFRLFITLNHRSFSWIALHSSITDTDSKDSTNVVYGC